MNDMYLCRLGVEIVRLANFNCDDMEAQRGGCWPYVRKLTFCKAIIKYRPDGLSGR